MTVARRIVFPITIVTIVAIVISYSASSAASTSKIGPKQHYVGLVNAKHSGAVIRVACAGPAGHRSSAPIKGQTVNVKRVASGGGYTGSAAHEIWAQFGRDDIHVVGFASYNTPKPIPTSLRLPCSGNGTVTFTTCFGTMPCAAKTRADIVRVTFVNVAV